MNSTKLAREQSPPPKHRVIVAVVRWRATVVLLLKAFFLIVVIAVADQLGFSVPRLVAGGGRMFETLGFMLPPRLWSSWDEIRELLSAVGETVGMAFLGTWFAAIIAIPLSMFGASSVTKVRSVRFGVRRTMDAIRSVDQLIVALIFIRAFGLGPTAGVLAIAVCDASLLAKLWSEAIESIDTKPVAGLKAAGANSIQIVRYGVFPQVLPVFLSQALYVFESNVRSSAILGIVGAGGIGYLLYGEITNFNLDRAATIIIVLVVIVSLIDAISERARLVMVNRPNDAEF